ncbi:hypothetical protein ACQCSX_09025 [Pseudarthrobacter sp. P1]|uniref:hypothetical protein n=1 Tax=Pseudarthrobacter sp. P1 TaxID=3418418 RepID=UPI003CEAA07A
MTQEPGSNHAGPEDGRPVRPVPAQPVPPQPLPPPGAPAPAQPAPAPAWGQASQWGQYAPPQQPWGQPPQPQWGQHAPPQPGYPQNGWAAGGGYLAPPKPGVIPLRPLSLGEVLDGAFQAARRNGKAMFGSALLVQAAASLLNAVVLVLFFSGSNFTAVIAGTLPSDELGPLVLAYGSSIAVAAMLQVLAQTTLQGVLVVPVLRAILNRHTGFKEMLALARPRIGTLLLAALLYMAASVLATAVVVAVAVLLVLWLGPGGIVAAVLLALTAAAATIWAGTKVMLAPAAIIVEDLGVLAAVARSWRLTTSSWWRTFGTYFVAALIAGAIGGVIATPVSLVTSLVTGMANPNPTEADFMASFAISQGVSLLVSTLVGAVTLAFSSGVMSLIYVDLRMRKEGFDVVLMRQMESAPYAPGIPGASGRGAGAGSIPGPGQQG